MEISTYSEWIKNIDGVSPVLENGEAVLRLNRRYADPKDIVDLMPPQAPMEGDPKLVLSLPLGEFVSDKAVTMLRRTLIEQALVHPDYEALITYAVIKDAARVFVTDTHQVERSPRHSEDSAIVIGHTHPTPYWGSLEERTAILAAYLEEMVLKGNGENPLLLERNGENGIALMPSSGDIRSYLMTIFDTGNKFNTEIIASAFGITEISLPEHIQDLEIDKIRKKIQEWGTMLGSIGDASAWDKAVMDILDIKFLIRDPRVKDILRQGLGRYASRVGLLNLETMASPLFNLEDFLAD